MNKLLIFFLLFTSNEFYYFHYINNIASYKIKNQLFINESKVNINEMFVVSFKDIKGDIFKIPIRETYIDLAGISKKTNSYEIMFLFGEYKLNIDLYTKHIISNEEIIWNWFITTDSLQQNKILDCKLRIDYVESEIEILFPVNCCIK